MKISAEQNLLDTIEFNYHQQGNFKAQFWKMMIEPVKVEAVQDLQEEIQTLSKICKTVESLEIKYLNVKEALEALVSSSECRGDEDCDHCEAIKVLENCTKK